MAISCDLEARADWRYKTFLVECCKPSVLAAAGNRASWQGRVWMTDDACRPPVCSECSGGQLVRTLFLRSGVPVRKCRSSEYCPFLLIGNNVSLFGVQMYNCECEPRDIESLDEKSGD